MQLIKKTNNKEGYEYVGISDVVDDSDWILMDKIVNIMRYTLQLVDIYICKAFKVE